jgi:hypothetical protein
MNDKPLEEQSLGQKAETALKEAVKKVVEEARRTGGTLVVWKNGAVAEIPDPIVRPQTYKKGVEWG